MEENDTEQSKPYDNAEDTTPRWPLDLPELPFRRYEHRPLSARDVLVHRIMSEYMFPSKVAPSVYSLTSPIPYSPGIPFFIHIWGTDNDLRDDLLLLRKMLCTISVEELASDQFQPVQNLQDYSAYKGATRKSSTFFNLRLSSFRGSGPPTFGDDVLDMVQRHFWELDDPCVRLWLHASRPPTGPSPWIPQTTLDILDSEGNTRPGSRAQVLTTRGNMMAMVRESRETRFQDADIKRLQSVRPGTRDVHRNSLFDGGAFLPSLRKAVPDRRHRKDWDPGDPFTLAANYPTLHLWPERCAPSRVVLHLRCALLQRLDASASGAGRGLDCDGIWSTASYAGDERAGRRGRLGRRRATSEPPPGIFTTVGYQALLHNVYEVRNYAVSFPRMTLASLDRRCRRRSLSRRRIAEMFDWDTMLDPEPDWEEELPVTSAHAISARKPGTRERAVPPFGEEYHHIRYEAAQQILAASSLILGHIDQSVLDRIYRSPFPRSRAFARSSEMLMKLKPHLCANCTGYDHDTSSCTQPCGHCGVVTSGERGRHLSLHNEIGTRAGVHQHPHLAPQCPVAPHNRCKCTAFPTFHVADRCNVVCSRPCGSPHPAGAFRHRNAMTCKFRCCMCGAKGHSGRQCKLKRCRCGGNHLGQDCGWNPACRVRGCGLYLCGLHCVECGGTEKPFVGGRCGVCLRNGMAVGEGAAEQDEGAEKAAQTRRGRRARRKNASEKDTIAAAEAEAEGDGPSWLPLKPRRLPVAKSTNDR